MIDLDMEIYGCKISVPILLVAGQSDDLIVGTNIIKHIFHQFKQNSHYWKVISTSNSNCPEQFLSHLAGLNFWLSGDTDGKVDTVMSNKAVTLAPGTE